MTQLDSRASISIWQLVFFTPALAAAIFLCIKHGFGRSSGWLFLLTVSLFRIAGAACQLATYSVPSQGLFIASAILGTFGLSTLLLASLGLLSRVSDSINAGIGRSTAVVPSLAFRAVQLITLIGLILSIVGDTEIDFGTAASGLNIPVETKIGVIILLVAWLLVALIAARVIQCLSHAAQAERPLAWAVLICLPFLLTRLVYGILTIFLNDQYFSLVFPDVVVVWTLSTIEECFVVFLFLLVGFKVPKVAKAERIDPLVDGTAQGGKNAASGGGGGQKKEGIRWRGSIIMTIIGAISYLFSKSKKTGPGGGGETPGQEMHHMPHQRQQQQQHPTSMV